MEMNATATKTHRKCWDCAEPATHIMTRTNSITLHACDRHARADRATAEASSWTLTPLAQIPGENHTHRVYFTQNGTRDPGTVTETARLLPNGDPSPKGDLYVRVAFDDGMTDWCHHSLLTSTFDECPDCGREVSSRAWVSDEHHPKCPHRDPYF